MNTDKKLELIKRNTVEIVGEEELDKLLKKNKKPVVYCGYEPSGSVHLGHFVTLSKLLDFEKAGFKVKVLLADVHAMLNRKGDEKQIKKEAELWGRIIRTIGLNAEIILGSSFEFEKKYQFEVMNLAQHSTIQRGLRSMQEVARDIENATISQVIYPLMQVVDIKFLNADVALGGMEQRKIHMLGKDSEKILKHKFIAIHTPLISSLKGEGKMSKSIPGSSIFLDDSHETIKNTIKNAYCPEKQIENNPLLQILKLIIFPRIKSMKISRPEKFGGNLEVENYEELENIYSAGKLHPMDLKNAVTEELEKIIGTIRKKIK
ncbi:tyrosine--tRNA ligase [Candidatus Pacearchaeota archaeon]|nr:tyrosine--tRNA ligase [Candidatus Pacearchaeota archaeon]